MIIERLQVEAKFLTEFNDSNFAKLLVDRTKEVLGVSEPISINYNRLDYWVRFAIMSGTSQIVAGEFDITMIEDLDRELFLMSKGYIYRNTDANKYTFYDDTGNRL